MKNYAKLWALLAISFIAFFIYSWIGSVTLFGYEIKTSKLAQSIIAENDTTKYNQQAGILNNNDTTSIENTTKEFISQPVDTASKTILFIGDSMLDGLSPRLASYAKNSGHTLYSVIWYSSSTEQWANKQRLTEYINKLNPNYIFICLGSNELFVKDIKDKRTKYVKSILQEIGSIPFVWIGPPNWKEDTGINDMLKENLPQGTFFVSNGMKFDRKKDGAHPTAASAIHWMDSVVNWMPKNSMHPIVLNAPKIKTDKPKRVFIHQPGQ